MVPRHATQHGRPPHPGYALIWTKDGIAYSLTGFGDSSQAVVLADSLR